MFQRKKGPEAMFIQFSNQVWVLGSQVGMLLCTGNLSTPECQDCSSVTMVQAQCKLEFLFPDQCDFVLITRTGKYLPKLLRQAATLQKCVSPLDLPMGVSYHRCCWSGERQFWLCGKPYVHGPFPSLSIETHECGCWFME